MKTLTKTKRTPWEELVAQAVRAEVRRRAVEDTLANRKLSARAFVALALRIAEMSDEDLAELERTLNSGGFTRYPGCHAFLREATRMMAEATWVHPTDDASRLRWMDDGGVALAELGTLGVRAGYFALQALGAKRATSGTPKSFGTVDDLSAHRADMAEAHRTRDELFARLGREWTAEDIELSPNGQTLVVKISAGAVPAHPKENLAERLVNYILSRPHLYVRDEAAMMEREADELARRLRDEPSLLPDRQPEDVQQERIAAKRRQAQERRARGDALEGHLRRVGVET